MGVKPILFGKLTHTFWRNDTHIFWRINQIPCLGDKFSSETVKE